MKSAILAVTIASLFGIPVLAQESEDWSDTASVNEVEIFVTRSGESASFTILLDQSVPLSSDTNLLCGDHENIFDSGAVGNGTPPPNCRPEIESGVPLNGTLTSLSFSRTEADQMRALFGNDLIDFLLAELPNASTIRLPSPLPNLDELLPRADLSLLSDQLLELYPNQYRIRSRFESAPIVRLGDVARYSSVVELEQRLNGLQIDGQQLDTNTAAIADHEQRISDNESSIATNRSDIANNRADIDQNRSDIAANTSGIQTNAAAITTNSTRISTNSAAIGVNSAQIARNMQDIDMLQQSMVGLDTRVTGVENQVGENRTGIAIAMAMSGGVGLQPGETFRMNANWGTWDGDSAFAVSGTYRASRRFMINAAAGSGSDGGEFGGRAGVSFGW